MIKLKVIQGAAEAAMQSLGIKCEVESYMIRTLDDGYYFVVCCPGITSKQMVDVMTYMDDIPAAINISNKEFEYQ